MKKPLLLIILLFLGLLLRLLFVPQPGFEGDIGFWKSWSQVANEKGLVWLTLNTDYNYPAGFTWILWLLGKTYHLFADPNNRQQYLSPNNYLFLLLVKIVPIVADLLIAVIIYWLLSRPKTLNLPEKTNRLALPLAGIYLFHPVVLFDGAWWGQVDSFGVLFAFLTVFFLAKNKTSLATISLTAGLLLKMQNIIFLPIFLVYLWQKHSWREMVKNLSVAFATYLIICFAFLLNRNLDRTFTLIINNTSWFPYLSLRAYNLWWLVAKGNWLASDKILTFGTTNALSLGRILFIFAYLLVLGLIFFRPKIENLIFSFCFSSLAFFFLPTQSHERYLFPFLALSILVLPYFYPYLRRFRLAITGFFIFSFTSLINLNNSLVFFYPKNGWNFLSFLNRPEIEIFICFFNFSVFLVFVVILASKLPKTLLLLTVLGLSFLLLISNINYLTGQPISLTKLKPVLANQDFGSLQTNQNLSSAGGWKTWSFLSVNHFFYRQGLATHANSKIAYDLAGKFSKFTTDYGVDSDAGENASVIFEIVADGKVLFTSPVVKKADLPNRAEVSIKNVKTLELIVKDAGDGITNDHADWLKPVLYR